MEKQAYEGVIHTKDRSEGLQAFKENTYQRIRGVNMLDQKQQSNSFEERVETIKQGGAPKYHEQNKARKIICSRSFSAFYLIMANM